MRPQPQLQVVRCRSCLDYVTDHDVEEAIRKPNDMVRLIWLHGCGTEGVTTMSVKRWHKIQNRTKDFILKAEKAYDSEAVGKAVQGFRIELDAVRSVSDMLLVWNDQERNARWSIPREKARA